MFDKTIINKTEERLVPYEKTVHEHRAPTDDSIRLYNEMKEKAEKSLIEIIKINDNSLNMRAALFHDLSSAQRHIRYQLTLNGKKIEGDFTIDEFDPKANDPDTIIRNLIDHVAHKISIYAVERILANDGIIQRLRK